MEQLLITTAFAFAFAFVGYKIGRIYGKKDVEGAILETVEVIINKLIRDGYLKTVKTNNEEIILKWWEQDVDKQKFDK